MTLAQNVTKCDTKCDKRENIFEIQKYSKILKLKCFYQKRCQSASSAKSAVLPPLSTLSAVLQKLLDIYTPIYGRSNESFLAYPSNSIGRSSIVQQLLHDLYTIMSNCKSRIGTISSSSLCPIQTRQRLNDRLPLLQRVLYYLICQHCLSQLSCPTITLQSLNVLHPMLDKVLSGHRHYLYSLLLCPTRA